MSNSRSFHVLLSNKASPYIFVYNAEQFYFERGIKAVRDIITLKFFPGTIYVFVGTESNYNGLLTIPNQVFQTTRDLGYSQIRLITMESFDYFYGEQGYPDDEMDNHKNFFHLMFFVSGGFLEVIPPVICWNECESCQQESLFFERYKNCHACQTGYEDILNRRMKYEDFIKQAYAVRCVRHKCKDEGKMVHIHAYYDLDGDYELHDIDQEQESGKKKKKKFVNNIAEYLGEDAPFGGMKEWDSRGIASCMKIYNLTEEEKEAGIEDNGCQPGYSLNKIGICQRCFDPECSSCSNFIKHLDSCKKFDIMNFKESEISEVKMYKGFRKGGAKNTFEKRFFATNMTYITFMEETVSKHQPQRLLECAAYKTKFLNYDSLGVTSRMPYTMHYTMEKDNKTGEVKFDYSCSLPCPIGYFSDEMTLSCLKCEHGCAICSKRHDCKTCVAGWKDVMVERVKALRPVPVNQSSSSKNQSAEKANKPAPPGKLFNFFKFLLIFVSEAEEGLLSGLSGWILSDFVQREVREV